MRHSLGPRGTGFQPVALVFPPNGWRNLNSGAIALMENPAPEAVSPWARTDLNRHDGSFKPALYHLSYMPARDG